MFTETIEEDRSMGSRTVSLLRRTAVVWVALLAGGGGYFAGTAVGESDNNDPVLEVSGEEAHDHASHDHGDEALPDIDPCALVTVEEAAAVLGPLGELLSDGAPPVTSGQRTCAFILHSQSLGAVVGVASGDIYLKLATMEEFVDFQVEVLPDLGVTTRWMPSFRILAVAQGEWLLSVQMGDLTYSVDIARDKAIQLARIAFNRLTED